MTFLQSWILYAIPLTLLPIVIHLINQNRHKTVQWAATMFLLQAKRMVRGMARLRYVLILIARMLAIAGLLLGAQPTDVRWLAGIGRRWTSGTDRHHPGQVCQHGAAGSSKRPVPP